MRTDVYTKMMLTIIAACLVWLTLGGPSLVTSLHAQQENFVLLSGWIDLDRKIVRFPRTTPSLNNSRRGRFP